MIVLAASLIAAGCGLALFAALPVRMRIERRATLMSLGGLMAWFGASLYLQQTLPPRPDLLGSLICGNAIMVLMALLVRLGLAWRMRRNVRDWETKWKYMVPKGPIAELFKRYHDID